MGCKLGENLLEGWDYSDEKINSAQQQINRQKSANDLIVCSVDKNDQTGIFTGGRTIGQVRTSLMSCECDDFNLSGGHPRKKFKPCMHMYRLAAELGLMKIKQISKKTLLANMTPEERKAFELKELQSQAKDPSQWGEWSVKLHKDWRQKERQYRAYEIMSDDHTINSSNRTGVINCYQTSLYECTCTDFEERKLPCKHIYCLALSLGEKFL